MSDAIISDILKKSKGSGLFSTLLLVQKKHERNQYQEFKRALCIANVYEFLREERLQKIEEFFYGKEEKGDRNYKQTNFRLFSVSQQRKHPEQQRSGYGEQNEHVKDVEHVVLAHNGEFQSAGSKALQRHEINKRSEQDHSVDYQHRCERGELHILLSLWRAYKYVSYSISICLTS